MKIMSKKIFREIWRSKFRSASIVILVAFTVAFLGGMRASYPMILATYDLNRDTYNVADGRFSFNQPIHENNATALATNSSFLSNAKINRIEGRVIFYSDITYNNEKFQAVIIGVEYPNKVNQLFIEEASEDITDVNQIIDSNASCLVETHFAGRVVKLIGQDVQLEDQITINFAGLPIDFTVKGIAQDTDYMYVVDESSLMILMGELAVVWINLETIQHYLFGGLPLINQILYTVEERFDNGMTLEAADELSGFFVQNNIDANNLKFEIHDETADYKMFTSDAGALDKMGTIFGIIGMIICSVVILNTLSKLVNSQRKNIGLFFTMGSRRRTILTHYLIITLLLAFIGVLLGIPLGYALSYGMSKIVNRLYGTHEFAFYLPPNEFLIGAASTLGICLIASFISAWPITNVTPREAMTATFTRIKTKGKSIAEKLLGWIPLFKPLHMTVPLREIFMQKRKTIITIFALTTSMIFLVDSLAMEYNMFDTMNSNFSKFNTYDVRIQLEAPDSIEKINDFINNSTVSINQDITESEVFINLFTKITHKDEFVSWTQLSCYQENSTMRNYNVVKGLAKEKEDLTSSEVLLGNAIAGKYDILLDDNITIGILGNYTVKVTGLVGELVDYSILWTYEAFQQSNITDYFGLPKGWVNGILLTVKEDTNLTALRLTFENEFNVGQWTEAETALKSTRSLMEAMMGVMLLFLVIGIAIAVIFSFQSMLMAFMDRQQDFLSFKAMGIKIKYVRKMIFWENAILSAFSLILTVPLGYIFYRWSLNYMLEDKFYVPLSIPWFTWPIVFLLSLFAIWLATARLLRKIKKIELHNELRQSGAT
ncbi:MAG: ABC transporter permease [Asgard group archaeon]|nr:ABC transporter permease [Asgard group archaeon]